MDYFALKLYIQQEKDIFTKNAENDYFNQRLGCAAPKRWLKYTTDIPIIDIVGEI